MLDVESGQIAASFNPSTPRSPASTIKVVTTFATLDSLGPAYTWHTQALLQGALEDGVLEGDLILKGGGDPYMTLERWWSFVQELRAKGLRALHGDIVIDDTAFALPPEDPAAFDGRPHQAYNAEPSAIMVNFQSVEFRLVPNPGARRVDIAATPAPVNLAIDNRIAFMAGPCSGAAARVAFEVPSAEWDRVEFSGFLVAAVRRTQHHTGAVVRAELRVRHVRATVARIGWHVRGKMAGRGRAAYRDCRS